MIRETKGKMESAAKEFDFIYAGKLRDELLEMKKKLKNKK
jgi:excinuclease UvrABC helicase subunit UvrB